MNFTLRVLFGMLVFVGGSATVLSASLAAIPLWPVIAFSGGATMGAGIWIAVGMFRW